MRARRADPFFWTAMLCGAVMLGIYAVAGSALVRHGTSVKNFGWQTSFGRDGFTVTTVAPGGPADGKLLPGDRVVTVAGEPVGRFGAHIPNGAIDGGEPYTVRVARGAEEREVELVLPPLGRDPNRAAHIAVRLAASVGFFAFALFLAFVGGRQLPVRLACMLFFAMALIGIGLALNTISLFLDGVLFAIYILGIGSVLLAMAIGYHFFYAFPPGLPRSRFFTAVQYGAYAVGAISLVPYLVKLPAAFAGRNDAGPIDVSSPIYYWAWALFFPAVFVVLAFAIAVLLRNYRLVTDADMLRRVRWVVFGSATSVTLTFLLVAFGSAWSVVTGRSIVLLTAPLLVDYSIVVTLFTPAAIAYAILKHRALDVEVVLRKGLDYALAKGVLQAALLLPLAGIVVSLAVNPNRTFADLFLTREAIVYGPLAALALLGLRYRGRLTAWVDRKFFREAYDREQIFVRLMDELKRADTITGAADRVSAEIERALHPKRFHVALSAPDGGFVLDGEVGATVVVGSWLATALRGRDEPVEMRELVAAGLPDDERRMLEELGVELVVPMVGLDGRLAGMLLLGERRSEEPYGPGDRELLGAVAAQMALARENVALKSRVERAEVFKRDVLSRLDEAEVNLVKECPSCGRCYDAVATECAADGAPVETVLPIVRDVDGKYRLDRLLGRGGMGAVYEALDLRLRRLVAVKVLAGRQYGGDVSLRRFEREAQTSARLNHPRIVTVYDYGSAGAEAAYLVMERLEGRTLRAVFQSRERLDPRLVAEWFDQMLEGIAAAHGAGVIHRDLKPENVFVVAGGSVKLLDFGLAKLRLDAPAGAESLTAPGTVMGTLGYMSFEQLTGGAVDQRADLFAVGVMGYEAVTGRRPFEGATWAEVLASVRRGMPRTGPTGRCGEVLARALEREPDDRYQTAAAMRAELVPALRDYLGAALLAADDDTKQTLLDDEDPTRRF